MAINNCVFMGNLGDDPDIKHFPDGTTVANLSIACGKKWKDKVTGELKEHTEWIRAVVFGKRAEVIGEYFKKGSQIHVTGEMRTRSYEKDGVKHWATEIVVSDFQFCGQRNGNSGGEKASQQAQAYHQQSSGNASKPDDFGDFDDLDIPF